ncbi:MAG: hypothetical protein K2Z81_23050 [Cyanobacteria bacterium]|nr:hypothetical protein [Cyanobacteriota bacterium]
MRILGNPDLKYNSAEIGEDIQDGWWRLWIRTEAVSPAFDKCHVEYLPDIVPFQLEQICTTDRVLRLLSDLWLERSNKALQSVASQRALIEF